MGVLYPLKGPSSASMTCSDNFKLNPNYVNRSCPKIISYLPLADSSTLYFHVTTFVSLSTIKVKYTLTLRLGVIFPACMCHCTGESFSGARVFTRLPITIVEIHQLSNNTRKF